MEFKKIGIISNNSKVANEISENLKELFSYFIIDSTENIPECDLLVVLGGDGFMLHTIHNFMHLNIPFYGINCGTVGFLMNKYDTENLNQSMHQAQISITYPLEMKAILLDDSCKTKFAINEVSLFRKSSQAAKLRIIIDGELRLKELVSDGILLTTPAGSSAYNSSVNGPILPIGSNILALTPISPFRPKWWRGALLPHNTIVTIEVTDHKIRPVNAVADFLEVGSIKSVSIRERRDMPIELLFNQNHSLEERIIREQFHY